MPVILRLRWIGLGVVAVLGLARLQAQTDAGAPTFAHDVAPIVYRHCAVCHHPGGIGPFSLLGYTNVRRRALQIGEVVGSGFMPPWKPDPHYGPPLQGARGLTADEIMTLQHWAAAGAPSGDLAMAPAEPAFPEAWTLGTPDLVLELSEPFTLPADGKDVFRNFVIPIPVREKRYVRALEFLPRAQLVIHHATMALDHTASSRHRDEAEPGPGFSSMDLGNAVNPSGHIIGWTPGQVPYETYPGTAWEVTPGTDLVLQLHMLRTGKPEAIRPQIGLYFTDQLPTRASAVVLLRENQIDIPAGASDYEVEESLRLPVATQVLGLYPHAHYLGHDLRVYAELPDGNRQWLMRIPDWDFNWQSDYRYVEPLPLPAGTTLVMRYSYDNSAGNVRNPFQPPRRVQAGWSSFDEMGEVAIQLLLEKPADALLVDEAQARYELTSSGESAVNFYNLAIALDYQGRGAEAASFYEQALALDPTMSRALNNLGAIREQQGDDAGGEQLYHRAVAADPELIEARLNLAKVLRRTGRSHEAAPLLARILASQPEHRSSRLLLAELRMRAGDVHGARNLLEQGRMWHREAAEYLVQLGKARAMDGDRDGALRDLTEGVKRPVLNADGGADPKRTSEVHGEAWYSIAILRQQRRDWPGVVAALSNALVAKSDHADARLMAAALAMAMGDAAMTRSHLAALVALPPSVQPVPEAILDVLPFPEGVTLLAGVCVEAGQRALALRVIDLGLIRARAERRDEVVRAFQELRGRI